MLYQHRPHHYFAIVVAILFSFLLGWQATSFGLLAGQNNNTSVVVSGGSDDVDMDLFWKVWNEVDSKYIDVDSVNEQDKVYGAIKGMVDSLGDSYTSFMTPAESAEFNSSLEGTLEGIGAELTVEDKKLVIVSPLRESPAEKAGLLPGDIIYKINGELASDMSLFNAVMKIRGEKGTTVKLTIIREGVHQPFDISIIRDSISVDSITSEDLDGGIKYISVNQFNDKTTEEFGNAVTKMILDEPKGLIIDLRYNGGGYLDIAVELLSYILPSNTEAVTIKYRGKEDEVMKTNGNPKVLNVPLVVLINEGSASASEIVAGAVQDHKRGIVMGTQSFGKGSVQEVESFGDGSSMRITIAKWYTPDDRNVNKVGLTPDVVVELTEEDSKNNYDRQKEEALKYLRGL